MFYSGTKENIDYNLNRKPEATVVKMKSLSSFPLADISGCKKPLLEVLMLTMLDPSRCCLV